MQSATRQLAAIMFADMVGYTAMMNENEYDAKKKLDRFGAVLQQQVDRFSGSIIQNYGDGSLAIFKSALEGVRCAIHVQQQLQTEPKIDLRIGLHTGDIIMDTGNVFGDGVNIASRIESLAVPGSVFISQKLFDEIRNQEEIKAHSLGIFELKNVKQPMEIYAISNAGLKVPPREILEGKTKAPTNKVVVLPFVNMSNDADNEFFCDGITEEIINALTRVSRLQIISRTSSFAFKGKTEDVRDIGRKLNIDKVVEGSVRKAGNRLRITAQLINAADGYHIWSENYDRNLTDIFELQDEISISIAGKLREMLTPQEQEKKLLKAPTENLDAYKKYVHATQLWDHAEPENRRLAFQLFHEAAEMDPKFVNPLSYIAIGYGFMGQTGQMPANEAFRLAHEYADKALRVDSENPFTLMVMAFLKLYNWEWTDGYKLVERALAVNPNDAMAHLIAAEYSLLFLNSEKELEHAKMSYQLDPLSANNIGEAARHFLFAGKTKEALDLTHEALLLDPENLVSRNIRAYALAISGEPEKAIDQLLETYKIAGDFPLVLMAMGFVYSIMGNKEKVTELILKLELMMKEAPETHLDFAIAMLACNNNDLEKFYEAYDRGIERKALWMIQFYGTLMMRPVWYDAHVIASRKKLGLPVFEESSKSEVVSR